MRLDSKYSVYFLEFKEFREGAEAIRKTLRETYFEELQNDGFCELLDCVPAGIRGIPVNMDKTFSAKTRNYT